MTSDEKKKPCRDHRKKFWHTKETCYTVHGNPMGGKKKPKRALQTVAEDSSDAQVNFGRLPS